MADTHEGKHTRPNRLTSLFSEERTPLLSVYLTAGYPALDSTVPLCVALQNAGVDLLEIGMPFSDPVADGPTIQQSSEKALQNGMSLEVLFAQLQELRAQVSIPVLLMGYINPVLQFGAVRFVEEAAKVGIDGVIIPDLPLAEYQTVLGRELENRGLASVLLVTSETADDRIRLIDSMATGFVYAVSSPAITGGNLSFDEAREQYFRRLKSLRLRNGVLVGFGVSDKKSFQKVSEYTHGAIVGSAFIRALDEGTIAQKSFDETCLAFVKSIRG